MTNFTDNENSGGIEAALATIIDEIRGLGARVSGLEQLRPPVKAKHTPGFSIPKEGQDQDITQAIRDSGLGVWDFGEEKPDQKKYTSPADSFSVQGPIENQSLLDGSGPVIMRYLLPNNMLCIWKRRGKDLTTPWGFQLLVEDPSGKQVLFVPLEEQ